MRLAFVSILCFTCAIFLQLVHVWGQVVQNETVESNIDVTEIRVRQVAKKSIGDKFAWKPEVLSAEVDLSHEQTKLITKYLNVRLENRETSIAKCLSRLSTLESGDKKTLDECFATLSREELSHEKELMDQLQEILLPNQYVGMVHSIIRADNLGFAEIPACAEFLQLTDDQQTAFVKAQEKVVQLLNKRAEQGKSNLGVIPEDEKVGEAIMSPIHSLNESQLERYLQARKMVENGVSLEEHYKKTEFEGRSRLKRMFPLFKSIESRIESNATKSKQ